MKSADEAARHEDMRGLAEENIGDVFTTGYYAVSDAIKDSSVSFVQNVITDMLYRKVLDETLAKNSRAGHAWKLS